jgi:hypothetical protein
VKRFIPWLFAFALCAAYGSVPQLALAVTIPTLPVGNAGNEGEVRSQGTFGAVAYDYRIGTIEVTVGQYTDFLNAVAATDTYALYHTSMATDLNSAGISRSGLQRQLQLQRDWFGEPSRYLRELGGCGPLRQLAAQRPADGRARREYYRRRFLCSQRSDDKRCLDRRDAELDCDVGHPIGR